MSIEKQFTNVCCCCGNTFESVGIGDMGIAAAEVCDVCPKCHKAGCQVLTGDICKVTGKKQHQCESITEHPDVQRLIRQVVELQAELNEAHWAVALLLLKISDGKGIIGLIELPDGRVYSLPVEILAEVKQALKGQTNDN